LTSTKEHSLLYIVSLIFKDMAWFSAADGGDITLQSFESSLMFHVLFSGRLLLHEAYFFNSPQLLRHIEETEFGMFEAAAASGLIVPAFSNLKCTSMEQAHADLRERHPNASPSVLAESHVRMISAMNAAFDSRRCEPLYWPQPGPGGENTFGVSYQRQLAKLFNRKTAPIKAGDTEDRKQLIKRVWRASKEWRTTCLETACAETGKNGFGLARRHLHEAIMCSLGLKEIVGKVQFSQVATLLAASDPEKALALTVFSKWITQCHWVTFANLFSAKVSLPDYDLDRDFVADALVPLHKKESNLVFTVQVALPPIEVLSRVAPNKLLEVRESAGLTYFNQLQLSLSDYSRTDQRGRITLALKRYCKAICSAAQDTGTQEAEVSFSFADVPELITAGSSFLIACCLSDGPTRQAVENVGGIFGLYVLYNLHKKLTRRVALKARDVELSVHL
jgi:hypothetical protein